MPGNDALPRIEVEPDTFTVRVDGEVVEAAPAVELPHGPALLPVLRWTTADDVTLTSPIANEEAHSVTSGRVCSASSDRGSAMIEQQHYGNDVPTGPIPVVAPEDHTDVPASARPVRIPAPRSAPVDAIRRGGRRPAGARCVAAAAVAVGAAGSADRAGRRRDVVLGQGGIAPSASPSAARDGGAVGHHGHAAVPARRHPDRSLAACSSPGSGRGAGMNPELLVLADSRLPSGGHGHSGGVEARRDARPAAHRGRPGPVPARPAPHRRGDVAAAAAAACLLAGVPGTAMGRLGRRGGRPHPVGGAAGGLARRRAARCCAPSRGPGRDRRSSALQALRRPHHPLVLGVAAAAAGATAEDAAALALHHLDRRGRHGRGAAARARSARGSPPSPPQVARAAQPVAAAAAAAARDRRRRR